MRCGASAMCCGSRAVFPSIRAQLTAWLALLVTLCLAAFAVYLYVSVSHILTVDLDNTLHAQAQQVAATYHFDAPDSGDEEKDEQRVGLVVIAASLAEITATTRVLLGLLVGGGLGVLLLAILGIRVLVRRGLRPLAEMATV